MMSSPLPTVLICIVYVYLVKVWGPNFMKHREPINCQTFMLIYNAFQVSGIRYALNRTILARMAQDFPEYVSALEILLSFQNVDQSEAL